MKELCAVTDGDRLRKMATRLEDYGWLDRHCESEMFKPAELRRMATRIDYLDQEQKHIAVENED